MGACTFGTTSRGKTAREAFKNAVEEACYEHGHGGYTGTIAEKDGFKMIELSQEVISDKTLFCSKIEQFLESDNFDKWGPAGCIKLSEDEYYFFGWACS